MTAAGWIIMTISVTAVLCLAGYCLARVLSLPPIDVEEHLKGPFEIDTRDMQDGD
jgi:hypothetical protein